MKGVYIHIKIPVVSYIPQTASVYTQNVLTSETAV